MWTITGKHHFDEVLGSPVSTQLKENNMIPVLITVQWDTDGLSLQECSLSEKIIVPEFPTRFFHGDKLTDDGNDMVSDKLTDVFGFGHFGFEVERLDGKVSYQMGNYLL